MKTTVVVEYTDEEKKLINTPLPPNPCDTCDAGPCCHACPEVKEYAAVIKRYKDAGVYDIARKIEHMRSLEQQAREIAREYNKLGGELPEFANKFKLVVQTHWIGTSKES